MTEQLIGAQKPVRRILDPDEAIAALERAIPGLVEHRRREPATYDWTAAEAVGTTLPADYRRLCELYPAFELDDFMGVFLPGPEEETDWARRSREERERWHSYADGGLVPAEVAPGSLLSWGESMEGDDFLWSTGAGGPEEWLVTVCSRNGPWWHYEGGMVQFLAELCDGTLEPWALPPVRPEATAWWDGRGVRHDVS